MKKFTFRHTIIITASLLSIPLIAMFFTESVDWSAFDFLVMALMLIIGISLVQFVTTKIQRNENRLFWLMAVVVGFFLLWAEMAVGIFGSPIAGS